MGLASKDLVFILVSFLLGFLLCFLLFSYGESSFFSSLTGRVILESPENFVNESQIFAYEDRVVIYIEKATIGNYLSTGSMEPFINYGANSINVRPRSEDQVNVGDIVSFNQNGILVSHRVIFKGYDEVGVYFTTRGDNNLFDDDSIRFEDINSVVVGIIY